MRTKPALMSLALSALFILFGGCSKDNPVVPATSDALNLTAQFGGYTATDEPVAFGDPEIQSIMAQDPPCEDSLFVGGEADSLCRMSGVTVYALAIRWGMLKLDSTVTQTTDWSGSLTLTHGFIHVVRTIQFEEGQDHIVDPRPNRQALEWVSFTSKSFDGLMLAIIVPTTPPDSDWSNNQLSFQTGPYSRTFTLSELDHFNEIIDVGTEGNQVAFNAINLTADSCGAGQLEGRWVLNPSRENGHFLGKWMTDDGLVLGYLRGHFGARSDSGKVFFGKYIGLEGLFRGLIRGTWGFDPNDSTKGWFDGIWAGRAGTALGQLQGQWGSAPPDSTAAISGDYDGNGYMNGHGRGRDRNPNHNPTFGTSRWTPSFFSGQWNRDCATDSTGL
jgi:hypothetical protein